MRGLLEAFEAVLGRWVQGSLGDSKEAIAIDGKGLRGMHGEELLGVRLVTLYEAIALLFDEPPFGEKCSMVEQRGRHGDRREVRRLRVSTALTGYLTWPGVRQVCEVERAVEYVRSGVARRREERVRYAVTSLGPEVMAALRDLVIGLLRCAGVQNVAAASRGNGWQGGQVLKLLHLSP